MEESKTEKKRRPFTFPEFNESQFSATEKDKMISELLKRLGTENPDFQEENIREKLARYDELIKKYQVKKDQVEAEELELEKQESQEPVQTGNEDTEKNETKNGEDESVSDKTVFDPEQFSNLKNPKKKELFDYLMAEKAACSSIKKQMKILETELYDVNLRKRNNIVTNLFEESSKEISKALDNFAGLERDIINQLNDSSSDESDANLKEELTDINELYTKLDKELSGFRNETDSDISE